MTKWVGAIVILAGVTIAIVVASILPLETARPLLSEDGPIELASAFLWFTLALTIVIVGIARDPWILAFAYLAALAGARELDAHAAFTNEPVTNLRYWVRDSSPASEKILVAAILIALIAVIVLALKRHGRTLVASILAGDGATWSVATIFLAAPVLILADGAGRYYTDFTGEDLTQAVEIFPMAIEEIGELMLSVIGFIAIGQYSERGRAHATAASHKSPQSSGKSPDAA
jgi:hypothetical protein